MAAAFSPQNEISKGGVELTLLLMRANVPNHEVLMAQLTVFTNPASNVMAMARNLGVEMSEEEGKVEAAGLRWLKFLKAAGY